MRQIRGTSTGAGIFPDMELHSSGERRLHAHESENLKNGNVNGNMGGNVGNDGGGENGNGAGDDLRQVKQEPGVAAEVGASSADTPTETPRSAKTIYLVSKSREMHHKFQSSVFYVRSTKEVPDVVRYSDRLRPPPNIDSSAVLGHCLGGRKRTRGEGGGVFVPEELCGGQRRVVPVGAGDEGARKKAEGLNLAALAAKIKSEGGMDKNDEDGGADEEDGEEYVREEDGEESDGADYVQNYYESEGDDSGGSDGEPTF